MKVVLNRNLGGDLCVDLELVKKGEFDPTDWLQGKTLDIPNGRALDSLLAKQLVKQADDKKLSGVAKEPALAGTSK